MRPISSIKSRGGDPGGQRLAEQFGQRQIDVGCAALRARPVLEKLGASACR